MVFAKGPLESPYALAVTKAIEDVEQDVITRFKAGELEDKAAPLLVLPVPGDGPLTMTSREIAELTSKRHDSVLRDVRRMLEDLEEGDHKFAGSYLSAQNKELPEYRLPKDLTICLVAGYDAKLRLTIIRRWEELERRAQAGTLADPSAPRLAAHGGRDHGPDAPRGGAGEPPRPGRPPGPRKGPKFSPNHSINATINAPMHCL